MTVRGAGRLPIVTPSCWKAFCADRGTLPTAFSGPQRWFAQASAKLEFWAASNFCYNKSRHLVTPHHPPPRPNRAARFRAAALGTRHLALRHSHSATRPTWDAPSRPFQALQRWSPSPSDALGEHSDRALSTQRSRNYIWPWHQSAKHSGGEVTANWQACSVRRAGVTACVALGAQPCCGEH